MNDDTTNRSSNDRTERYYAEMEAARNEIEKLYFLARPQVPDTVQNRTLFRAGFERAFTLLWDKRRSDETKPEPDVGALNRQLCEAEGHVFSRFAMHHCLRCEAAVTPGGYLAYTSSQKAGEKS